MTFEEAVAIIIDLEGRDRVTDNPRDPGGLTKWGISQKSYPNEDIRNMTRARAEFLYRRDYWDLVRIDAVPASSRLLVFDAAINQGQPTAVLMMQNCVGVKRDGRMGPKTIAALCESNPKEFFLRYVQCRQTNYLAQPDPSGSLAGWLNRLVTITLQSLKRMGDLQ